MDFENLKKWFWIYANVYRGYIINIFDFLPVKFLFFEEDCDFPPEIKFLWDENVLDYIRFETTFFAFSHLLHRIAEVIEGEI